jgi:hypothetical protein
VLTRRDFLVHFGSMAAATAAVAALPDLLRHRSWWSTAYAQDADLVLDTFNGLAAMVWPGSDPYSVAQGESNERPGAIAANAGHHTVIALDGIVAGPDPAVPGGGTVPLSGAVASAMNSVALQVNPAAAGGGFPSPFARPLSEGDPTQSAGFLQNLFGVLPALVAFLAFSEVDVFDPQTRTLTARPVGWDHCGYLRDRTEPVDGWDDLLGYYQDRREVEA